MFNNSIGLGHVVFINSYYNSFIWFSSSFPWEKFQEWRWKKKWKKTYSVFITNYLLFFYQTLEFLLRFILLLIINLLTHVKTRLHHNFITHTLGLTLLFSIMFQWHIIVSHKMLLGVWNSTYLLAIQIWLFVPNMRDHNINLCPQP